MLHTQLLGITQNLFKPKRQAGITFTCFFFNQDHNVCWQSELYFYSLLCHKANTQMLS